MQNFINSPAVLKRKEWTDLQQRKSLFSSDEKMNSSAESFADSEQTNCVRREIAGISQIDAAFAISLFNIPLSITILLGNTVILIALKRDRSLFPSSKLLLLNLVSTDLCVGLIAQPVYIIFLMFKSYEHWQICRLTETFSFISTFILCGVSLWTVTAISVDRLLALVLRVRYRRVVTVRRIRILVLVSWIYSISSGLTFLWNINVYTIIGALSIVLFLVISTLCYTTIFFILRRHQSRCNPNQGNNPKCANINVQRYKRTLSSALWITCSLIACYLPLAITLSLRYVLNFRLYVLTPLFFLGALTQSLAYLNSLLNPLLYCWKIREVREEVKKILKKICCLFKLGRSQTFVVNEAK